MINNKPGKLFLCATPIGNLEDITLRVLRTLKEVDLIAAEDTRRTRKLLSHYDIHTPLVSFNQANEQIKLPALLTKLKKGKKIALVSDAGTPGIADPGHILVKACLEAELAYELLPGASALIAAAVISGLPTSDVRFLGFLPRRRGQRQILFEKLAPEPSTLIFYESPRRLINTLKDIASEFPGRRLALIKEMTKKFAARYSGTATEILAAIADKPVKGEYVIVIEGSKDKKIISQKKIEAELVVLLSSGASKSEAAKTIAKKYQIPRRPVYESALRVMKKR